MYIHMHMMTFVSLKINIYYTTTLLSDVRYKTTSTYVIYIGLANILAIMSFFAFVAVVIQYLLHTLQVYDTFSIYNVYNKGESWWPITAYPSWCGVISLTGITMPYHPGLLLHISQLVHIFISFNCKYMHNK